LKSCSYLSPRLSSSAAAGLNYKSRIVRAGGIVEKMANSISELVRKCARRLLRFLSRPENKRKQKAIVRRAASRRNSSEGARNYIRSCCAGVRDCMQECERTLCELYCQIQIQTAALQQQLQRETLFANPQAHSLIIFHRRVHFDKCFSISRASNACKVCISHCGG
jgi:hypothetical protein